VTGATEIAEAFEAVCEELERATSLDRLEARGTVRLALKRAGLEARSVTPDQMSVVVENLFPNELESRGVQDVAVVCASIRSKLSTLESVEMPETPKTVFERLGGRV